MQKAFDETSRHVWGTKGGAGKENLNAGQAVAFFGPDTPVSEITSNRVVEWMVELQDEHKNADDTCNKKLSALSMMLKRAVDFGGLSVLPRLQRYKVGDHRISWFTETDERNMLSMARHLGLEELHGNRLDPASIPRS